MSGKGRKKFEVEIAPDECKGCGRCVTACPKNILHMTNKVNVMGIVHVEADSEGCVGCGACFYACPEPGAITIYEISDSEEDGA